MQMKDVLQPGYTRVGLDAPSKKRLMQFASDFIAEKNEAISASDVYDGLIARERLGSTAVGAGAAIPHCRLPGLENALVALFQLREAIPFDAPDGRPVQVVFVLLVPADATDDHLQILKLLAESLSDQEFRIGLLEADSDEALYDAATRYSPAGMAESDPA